MAEALRLIALENGAENGARLAQRLAMPASPDILLSLVKKASLVPITPPQVVGIDDWARLRGRTYGTIVVDLQQRHPLALLPNREAGELANWLRQYPSIKVVSRDRSSIYAEAARRGAPQALQVADKFHLISFNKEFDRNNRSFLTNVY
jgi:transposase